MLKNLITFFLVLISFFGSAQIQPIPKAKAFQEINPNLKPNGEIDVLKKNNHPLAITGGIFVLGGAATYIVGSETNNSKYSPENTTQYVGIGLFAAGAILFTVFSAEKNDNVTKRKKVKKNYDAADWEAP